MSLNITRIERVPLDIPYLERVREHLQKGWGLANRATDDEYRAGEEGYIQQWRNSSTPSVRTTVYRVHTDEGLIGTGEGKHLSDDELCAYEGRSPFEFAMDDSVGPLQIAFYDLMGQALGMPVARLLGPSSDSVPFAYWSHCFPPEVLQQEARIAVAAGFKVHKLKRRAHSDVVDQVAAIAEVAPADYEITVDANGTFGTVDRALEVGRRLRDYPHVKCLESPVDQKDVEAYRLLKWELDFALAIHYGTPEPIEALHAGVYDYFVLGGGAASLTRSAHIIAAAGKPFWMQQAESTDVAALFMVHLAAAIPNATLGHVSLHILLEHGLLREPLVVREGRVSVPTKPGLGAELDMDAVDRYRIG